VYCLWWSKEDIFYRKFKAIWGFFYWFLYVSRDQPTKYGCYDFFCGYFFLARLRECVLPFIWQNWTITVPSVKICRKCWLSQVTVEIVPQWWWNFQNLPLLFSCVQCCFLQCGMQTSRASNGTLNCLITVWGHCSSAEEISQTPICISSDAFFASILAWNSNTRNGKRGKEGRSTIWDGNKYACVFLLSLSNAVKNKKQQY